MKNLLSICSACFVLGTGYSAEDKAQLKDLSINGGVENGKARLTIEGWLTGGSGASEKSAFATALQQTILVERNSVKETIVINVEIVAGTPSEVPLSIGGEGEIRQVTGDSLQDWSIRQETDGSRTLVLRPRKSDKPPTKLAFTVTADRLVKEIPSEVKPLSLTPPQPALLSGYLKIQSAPQLAVHAQNPSGLVPLDPKFLPDGLKEATKNGEEPPLAFRFQGTAYSLALRIDPSDPEAHRVVLRNFRLNGRLNDQRAAFTLSATAVVKDPKGGSIDLLAGSVALTDLQQHPGWRVRFDQGKFIWSCDRAGEFPIELKFDAKVQETADGVGGWSSVDFRVAPAVLQPLTLQGLPAETQFEFAGAARPERERDEFRTFLPADGAVKLSWKRARPESEGKLFYAVEMLSQITVAPGLMRQAALLDIKVMQGEMNRLTLILRGSGEVTRVQGTDLLAWNIEPVPDSADRRLVVQFNQPQKDNFSLQVHMQTPLGAFPQVTDAIELHPENATRFAGYFRIANEGAVRLEVVKATGLSQISPEKFPESDATRAVLRPSGSQRFAYRFSGGDFGLKIQADQVQPELTVSELLAYRVGESDLTIDGEIELDIREAPLRELLVHMPKGYAVARLTVAGLSDYFVREPEDQPDAELRLVFGQPVSGRQVVQLRLERNKPLGEATWGLPRIEVVKAKSVRGHLAVAADAGFRITPERTQGLTDIATAFFPAKVAGIQSAFRLSEAAWQASIRVERLPQTVQVDGLHLFSIGEGIAYGSSVLNYSISGSPVSAFRLELSDEYFNVEFTGKNIRNWQKTNSGYVVQLHSPASGAYTLLATYERPFKAQGETLTFTGARPLDTQSDQGHTVIISAYQFQVKPVEVSSGLLPLETREVPPEYRLFFDAPILAAYRYNSRPFNLKLALTPLAQGDSLSQVVDRAALTTRISKEGQVLTEARYFIKNRGNPNLRLTLPADTRLWSTTVNGASVVPVLDGTANLIPLPQNADPNSVLTLELKMASPSKNPKRVQVTAPILGAPVMLADWKLEPDTGQRLVYRSGSLAPPDGVNDISGFAELVRTFKGSEAGQALFSLVAGLALLAAAIVLWRWATHPEVSRFSARHVSGALFGLAALGFAVALFAGLFHMIEQQRGYAPRDISFLVPVQQSGSALNVEVTNIAEKASFLTFTGYVWPVILVLAVWFYGWISEQSSVKTGAWVCGWTILSWAALRAPNGATAFFVVMLLFLLVHVVIPALRQLWRVAPRPEPRRSGAAPGTASATAAVVIGSLLCALAFQTHAESEHDGTPVAQSVIQEIHVDEKYATASMKIRWQAEKGQLLPLLFEPAVLTHITYPTNGTKLVQGTAGSKRAQELLAFAGGVFDVEITYELQVTKRDAESGLTIPVQHGLINEVKLTLNNLDVDLSSPQAISVERERSGSDTVAKVVLSPADQPWLGWKPRTRDVQHEKPVFYAEISQLYAPAAGVIEGAHYTTIRMAQGELSELVLTVPAGATITDVLDPLTVAGSNGTNKPPRSIVSLWRFDPDTRKLRVSLNPPQSRAFGILIRSQVATGPLPLEQSVGLLSVEGAAGQIGLVGFATGNEVQLDTVTANSLSPINLEDFPGDVAAALQGQSPGLTVRRAFRYADPAATASLTASAVEPDVRVETQDTLSLGEDRTVLAANPSVEITRAGIFRLSFVMPPGFDVESISGPALSHWTDLKTDAGRIITLNLTGKTEGKQQFAISVAGPGVKATNGWTVPQIQFREAAKQRGTLLLVPEQGLRLQVASSDGLTQLDPQKSGIKQKGVLAFRVLQTPRTLTLNIEQVDPWVQVTSVQHATVGEAQVKIAANLQYQIENTGVKSLRVFVPTNAESVRFQGDQVADFIPVQGSITNGLQAWEIKLHRRVIGTYLLQASWQTTLPEKASEFLLRGIEAADVNLQRGFVTVQSGGRLQVRVDAAPSALQAAEWQSIPRALQQGLPTSSANFTYRLVEASYELPLKFERHEAASLLPARVNNITFHSVISDDGMMLTQARLELVAGDKRLLKVSLPKDSRFWFAFANENGVWPWREGESLLIPLEKQSRPDAVVPVEVFYTCRVGAGGSRSLNLELLAPKFDLPLENITWHVSLSDKWKLTKWSGSLQLQEDQVIPQLAAINLESYLQTEASQLRQRTKQAEDLLSAANSALQQGDPQQARRDFQAAYGLSTHDAAFNEDARVQLHNIKLQQALIGLNVRQASTGGEAGGATAKLRELRGRKELNYTQQDAKEIIDRNSDDENATFMRLAERLIQQQDAAVTSPTALRASIPDQGRMLTFKRAVAVNPDDNLIIGLKASEAKTASWSMRLLVTVAILIVFALLARSARDQRPGVA